MRVLSLILAAAVALPALAETIVFRDVNVVAMTSPRVAQKQTVIVRDGRIESISANAKVPKGARVVNAAGKYLIPGLAEMHGHIPPPGAPKGMAVDVLYLYLANGITTVRGMLGHEGQLEMRENSLKGNFPAPNLYLAGPSFNGQSINSPEAAAAKVREQKKEGWHLLKVHGGLERDEYDAMAKTAREVGITFGGHVPAEVGLLHAIEMGQDTFDHIDGYVEYLGADKGPVDEKKLAEIVKKSKAAGVWIVPTSALWNVLLTATPLETLTSYDELKYVPASSVETWSEMYKKRSEQIPRETASTIAANRTRILRALHEGGVKILMGTDAPQQFSIPGFSLHRELKEMRAAGMSPYEILKSGTANVGEYFGRKELGNDSFGTIEPGKRADLVLLNANPLTDIENLSKIEGVMVRGRWFSREELDKRLKEIDEKYN